MAAVTTTRQAGIVGYIKDYAVVVLADVVSVLKGDEEVTREVVDGLGRFIAGAGDLRIGWAQLPDFEAVYLYDKLDSGFGYAVNLDWPGGSEWGYSPFAE
jgi:hypothetical protein